MSSKEEQERHEAYRREFEEQELKAEAAARVIAEEGVSCVLLGPVGEGKTLIARRIAKYIGPKAAFRAPHNTVSALGMKGQYAHQYLRGEIALADGGVLFLDDADEFDRRALEPVQHALKHGEVNPVGKGPSQPVNILVVATLTGEAFPPRDFLDWPGPRRLRSIVPALFASVWLVENLRLWTSKEMRGGRPVTNPATTGSQPQSVLVPTSRFSLAQAKAWIKSHGYKTGGLDETKSYYRFRQQDPDTFKRMRTIPLGESGIKLVVGWVR